MVIKIEFTPIWYAKNFPLKYKKGFKNVAKHYKLAKRVIIYNDPI